MDNKDRSAKAIRLRGGCMCGGVAYSVSDQLLYAMNSQCSKCRRTTGSAFKPIAGVAVKNFDIIAGQDELFRHGDPSMASMTCIAGPAARSSIPGLPKKNTVKVHVPMGTLVDPPSMKPSMHIFVGSKAPWYDILDGLPQFDGFPD
jgi:hypothetical protein